MSVAMLGRRPATLRLQELIGRVVVDADGQRLGRVVECIAAPRGDELRVVELLVGTRSWATRFGPGEGARGRRVRWEQIATLAPHITLRGDAMPDSGEAEQ